KAESSRVNAHRLVARLLGLSTGPVVQLVEVWRLVRKSEILLGSLKMRIARAAEPDVTSGIGGLRSQLRERFAGALLGDGDLDAGLTLKLGGVALTPLGLHAA